MEVIRTGNHDHQPNDRAVSKELITLRLVDKCKDDPSIPIKRVYDTVVDNLTDYDSDDAPTRNKMRARILPVVKGD